MFTFIFASFCELVLCSKPVFFGAIFASFCSPISAAISTYGVTYLEYSSSLVLLRIVDGVSAEHDLSRGFGLQILGGCRLNVGIILFYWSS